MNVLSPKMKYDKAMALYNDGDYIASRDIFVDLGNYKDSKYYIDKLDLDIIRATIDNGEIDVAYDKLQKYESPFTDLQKIKEELLDIVKDKALDFITKKFDLDDDEWFENNYDFVTNSVPILKKSEFENEILTNASLLGKRENIRFLNENNVNWTYSRTYSFSDGHLHIDKKDNYIAIDFEAYRIGPKRYFLYDEDEDWFFCWLWNLTE